MTTEENKAVERRIFEELFNKQNLAVMDELLDTNWVYHGTYGIGDQRLEEVKSAAKMIFNAFPDLHAVIEDMIAEGDKVATRFTFRGTHRGNYMDIAPTGKQVKYTGITISRFAGGKEVEVWDLVDELGKMQQLGVVPPMGQM